MNYDQLPGVEKNCGYGKAAGHSDCERVLAVTLRFQRRADHSSTFGWNAGGLLTPRQAKLCVQNEL